MQTNETRNQTVASLMDLLFRSGEALRNWQALATLMVTGVTSIVIFLALAASRSDALIFLGGFLALIILTVGLSATGILLMDQALGFAPRGIVVALIDGTFAALRLLVLLLIGLAVALVALLAIAILLVACKIPGLGGILYAVILPVSILTMAFIYAGLYFVASLAGPAVWSGASIRQAASALYLIVRNRLVEAALGVIFLTLLIAFIGGLAGAFVGMSTGAVIGMSAGILGSSFDFPSLGMYMMDIGGNMGHGGSILYGGMFGIGILIALVVAVIFCMMVLGFNRLYLHLSTGLDVAAAEEQLNKHMNAAKDRAKNLQEEARRRTEEIRQRSQQARAEAATPLATPPAEPSPPIPALGCPACGQSIAASDKFCENCGQKLG